MRRLIVLVVAALLLGGCSLTRELRAAHCPSSRRLLPAQSADYVDYVDFVQVGGTMYYAGYRAPAGRALRDRDLGAQVATVQCRLAEHQLEEPARYLDGDAAYLDPGTPVHAVNGYRPSFRLAARRDGRLLLYEAFENPGARTWGDLLDLDGRVDRIGIGSRNPRRPATVTDRAQVDRLVQQLLQSPRGTTIRCADHGNVLLTFHLADGTATSLGYNLPTRRLECRDPLPASFGAAIAAALA
jgi:hypothetical protein